MLLAGKERQRFVLNECFLQEKKDQMGGFDMFAADALNAIQENVPAGNMAKHGLLDQFDDSDGYYNFQVTLSNFSSNIMHPHHCICL